MSEYRISEHPILSVEKKKEIEFFFDGKPFLGLEGEMISSALFANDIKVFSKHEKDGAPQGIFCANGQCAQCLVLVNGLAVKSCITELEPNMKITSLNGLPDLPEDDDIEITKNVVCHEYETEVFILGAGPAGISTAIELGEKGVKVIIADDKHILGGKLGLQTHNFFGSGRDCNAGIRGMEIGKLLTNNLHKLDSVEIWLNSPVVGVFSDKKIGVVKNGKYVIVKPERFVVTAGAREKALSFIGCDLPGVYGAGAFQTLVNRDLVKAAKRLFVVGGGNVGLIAAYHALQAGIDVIGVVEALPQCGGYKVHLDKIKRLGVPVFTSHTVIRAEGGEKLERVIISEIDKNFKPIPGTEGEFDVDTLLIAVGLSPVNEMLKKAEQYGFNIYSAGDADIIAEASAAIFSGKIIGRKILQDMGFSTKVPVEWENMVEILRSKPGMIDSYRSSKPQTNEIYPIIRCVQEIPCNPCTEICLLQSVSIDSETMMKPPEFEGKCAGCGRCISICPGLSITLVDETYDENKERALVIIPWEMPKGTIKIGEKVTTSGFEGEVIGRGKIIAIKESKWQDRRELVYVETPFNEANLVAGIRIREPADKKSPLSLKAVDDDEVIICRCERVTKKEIKEKIMDGCRDFNSLKAELRTAMGPCGGKTCIELIWRIFRECGVDLGDVKSHVYRPFENEVSLKAFININSGGKNEISL